MLPHVPRAPRLVAIVLLAMLAKARAVSCPFHRQRPRPAASCGSSGSRALQEADTDGLLGDIPMAQDTTDPFVQANNAFQDAYSLTGEMMMPSPSIAVEGDYVSRAPKTVLWTSP
jgi:hypothetical protein